MVLVMAFIQPALSAIAFSCVATFGLMVAGWRIFAKRLLWQLLVILGIVLLNCLFVQRGATVLVHFGPWALHGESMVYGLSMGLALASALEIFALLSDVVPGDEALSMFGRFFPSSALLTSMALRLVPKMRRQVNERRDALKACTALPAPAGKVAGAAEEVSVMIATAMEDSLVTTDSMRARGYGADRLRTRYLRRRFSAGDGLALAIVVVLGVLAFGAGVSATAGFTFYPHIEGGADILDCVAFGAFFLAPHVAYAVGAFKWRQARMRL